MKSAAAKILLLDLEKCVLDTVIAHLKSRNLIEVQINDSVAASTSTGVYSYNRVDVNGQIGAHYESDKIDFKFLNPDQQIELLKYLEKEDYKVIEKLDLKTPEFSEVVETERNKLYFDTLLKIGREYNQTMFSLSERNRICKVRFQGPRADRPADDFKQAILELPIWRNVRCIFSKGKKEKDCSYYEFNGLLTQEACPKPKLDTAKAAGVFLNFQHIYNVRTSLYFNQILAKFVYEMSRYTHTLSGQEKRHYWGVKKSCVRFLYGNGAVTKIEREISNLGDTLLAFHFGDVCVHLRDAHVDFIVNPYNEININPEIYDGTKRNLENIDMTFMSYIAMLSNINQTFMYRNLNLI